MIRAHLHFGTEPPWSRQTVWGFRASCCRDGDYELLPCLCQACGIAEEVEYIITIIRDCLGPCSLAASMPGKLVAKKFPRACNLQLLVLSFSFDPWRPSLQQAGFVCMHLAHKMVQEVDVEPHCWNVSVGEQAVSSSSTTVDSPRQRFNRE